MNGDGVIDEDDALAMYYAYAYQSQLGNGDEDGFEESRRALLGGLAGVNRIRPMRICGRCYGRRTRCAAPSEDV